jgi:3-oxoacyl-[acyl-carrier protein] reductase
MTRELSGKTALVTGSASGIGAACALDLAAGGANIVLADIADLAGLSEQIRAHGVEVEAVSCDVSDEASVIRLCASVKRRFEGLDIAVNSAGILTQSRLLKTSIQEFDRILGVNLRGSFLIARGAVGLMQGRPDARLILIASELAYLGRAEFSTYCASKAGVIGLARSLARELAPDILVNSVAPGPVDTPMLGLQSMTPEVRQQESDNPLGRIGKPTEIAAVVRFLAGPGASFMTGQTVSPNGGAVMF